MQRKWQADRGRSGLEKKAWGPLMNTLSTPHTNSHKFNHATLNSLAVERRKNGTQLKIHIKSTTNNNSHRSNNHHNKKYWYTIIIDENKYICSKNHAILAAFFDCMEKIFLLLFSSSFPNNNNYDDDTIRCYHGTKHREHIETN